MLNLSLLVATAWDTFSSQDSMVAVNSIVMLLVVLEIDLVSLSVKLVVR